MAVLRSVFCLFVCVVLQEALGQEADVLYDVGIYGGDALNITDAPFVVSLHSESDPVCAGSIIHEQFILTSAYCALLGEPIQKVLVGSKDVVNDETFIDIEDKLCHENYIKHTSENDICLLKLSFPLEFNENVTKVYLPNSNVETAAGTEVKITGFGLQSDDNSTTNGLLQETTISIVSKETCLELDCAMTDDTFCAGSPDHDACEGDYGSPLTVNNVQIGIASYSTTASCGMQPSFYTKVSKYVNWIRNKICENS